MKNNFKRILLINSVVFLFILLVIESAAFLGRKFIGKSNVGFLIKIKDTPNKLKDNCQAMISHPFLGYVHDPSKGCIVKGGKIKNDYVEYPGINNYENAIITLGGSTTDGFYNHFNNGITWSYEFSKLLEKNNLKYSILNGGVGGYSSSQELIKLLLSLNNIDNKKNIKLVISLNGINEIPTYLLSLWQEQNLPYWNEYQIMSLQSKKYYDVSSKFNKLQIFPSTSSFFLNLKKREFTNNLKKYVSYEESFDEKIFKQKALQWERNVKLMNAIAREKNAQYFVFLQPSMGINESQIPKNENTKDFETYKLNLNKTIQFNKSIALDTYESMQKLFSELKKSCKKLDFCIDITKVAPPVGNNYSDPRHHNENGNRIIAKEIYSYIEKYLNN